MRTTATILWIALMGAAAIVAGIAPAAETTMPKDQVFLMEAAASQKAEIALGQMAIERGKNDRVKQFGRRMIEDHQKAGREVKQLASQAALEPAADPPTVHKDKAQHIAQLSGKEFDRTYIGYMLKDHIKDVTEFERGAKELKNARVQQWASATLPVLKEHLKMAKNIADELGIGSKTTE
jgi:putative membrane protein